MRIHSLDVLRGIAILGILFMNIYFHSHILLGYVPPLSPVLSDKIINVFNTIFVDGRFRTLFCILFGVGMVIQINSYKKKNLDAKSLLKSRFTWLLIFGLIHGIFIFGGDILLLYSICGLFVINKILNPTRTIYKLAIRYLLIGAVLNLFIFILFLIFPQEESILCNSSLYLEYYNDWFSSYFMQVLSQAFVVLIILFFSVFGLLWEVIGLMLLGAYLYKTRFFKTGFNSINFKRVLFLALFLILIDLFLRFNNFNVDNEIYSIFSTIPAIFVVLIYAHIVIKLVNKRNKILNLFKAPGKLAFSLYIFQSIFMAIFLRWIFPEFYKTATMLDYFLIAIAFSIFQVFISHLYLKYFNQGPLEYLWRKAYLKNKR